MTKIGRWAVVFTLAFSFCNGPGEKKEPAAPEVSYLVLRLPSGWGYSIYREGKLFIRQETIQAIPEKVPFSSERDAEVVAQEVVKKLKLQQSPRISVDELRQLGVRY